MAEAGGSEHLLVFNGKSFQIVGNLIDCRVTEFSIGAHRDASGKLVVTEIEPVRQPWLGSRFFKRLSDAELVAWPPADGVFHEGNFAACNKEIERRAARAGMTPQAWCTEKRQP
jgi:hypothetical protein